MSPEQADWAIEHVAALSVWPGHSDTCAREEAGAERWVGGACVGGGAPAARAAAALAASVGGRRVRPRCGGPARAVQLAVAPAVADAVDPSVTENGVHLEDTTEGDGLGGGTGGRGGGGGLAGGDGGDGSFGGAG